MVNFPPVPEAGRAFSPARPSGKKAVAYPFFLKNAGCDFERCKNFKKNPFGGRNAGHLVEYAYIAMHDPGGGGGLCRVRAVQMPKRGLFQKC